MRAHSLGALLFVLLSAPAFAIELVEMKDGRLYEAERVRVHNEKVVIRLHRPEGAGSVEFSVPADKVLPEVVFYAWRDQIEPGNVDEMVRLAEWSRRNGLFSHAWATYEAASDSSSELRSRLNDIEREIRLEHSAWLFSEAWRLFQKGDVYRARVRAERLIEIFPDSEEYGRALELLTIVREREQFLDEQKKQKRIASRARAQRRLMDRSMETVSKANRLMARANLANPLDARRRLRVAAFRFRKAITTLEKILVDVEVDDLRMMLIANLNRIRDRHVKGLTMLGDMRMLVGDPGGALTAAHEVLDFDPKNDLAKDLRKRALDASGTRRAVYAGWGYFGWRWRYRWRYPYPALYPGVGYAGIRYGGLGYGGLPGAGYGTYLSAAPYVGYQRKINVAPGVTAIKVSPRGPHPYTYPKGYHISRIGGRTFNWSDSYAFPNPNR